MRSTKNQKRVSDVATGGGKKLKLVGTGIVSHSKIKAAAVVPKKYIFLLDNICADDVISSSDVTDYLTSNNIQVLSCFSAKSWVKSRNTVTPSAFRVCVNDVDKSKIMCSSLWPEGVIVKEWVFKPKPDVPLKQESTATRMPLDSSSRQFDTLPSTVDAKHLLSARNTSIMASSLAGSLKALSSAKLSDSSVSLSISSASGVTSVSSASLSVQLSERV